MFTITKIVVYLKSILKKYKKIKKKKKGKAIKAIVIAHLHEGNSLDTINTFQLREMFNKLLQNH